MGFVACSALATGVVDGVVKILWLVATSICIGTPWHIQLLRLPRWCWRFKVVVFAEDLMGSRGSISHAHAELRRFHGVLANNRVKNMCWTIGVLQQCSRRVRPVTLTDFVLGGAF
jgi:hypothetical protein